MLRLLLVILCCSYALSAMSQQTIEVQGTVRDLSTGQPLPYVNLVLLKAYHGAVSNEAGEFRLLLPESLASDSVQFSFIGYASKKIVVKDLVGIDNDVRLHRISYDVAEALVRPLSAEEYVRKAVNRIADNYATNASLATGYYYELVTENDRFLKFEEAVTSTYIPGIGDSTQISVSVLHARAAKDVTTLQFMQSRNARKQQKANRRGKEYEPMIEGDDLLGGTGGPSDILGNDPVRDRPAFLDPKQFKHFRFRFEKVVSYIGRDLLVITFEQRKQLDHIKAEGKLYIDENDLAFVAIEYSGRFIIPLLLKPIIAMAGLGITDPKFNVRTHYSHHGGRWHVSSAHQDINLKLSTTEMFRKNDHSTFHIEQAFVVMQLQTEEVRPLAKEQGIKADRSLTSQALHNDPAFWETFNPTRPKRLQYYLN
jgi:hypothetical protein